MTRYVTKVQRKSAIRKQRVKGMSAQTARQILEILNQKNGILVYRIKTNLQLKWSVKGKQNVKQSG